MDSYHEFTQRVRRHRASELLAACALASIENAIEHVKREGPPPLPDFALAAVAKAAIVHGNDHRNSGVSRTDLRDMCGMFVNLPEPSVQDKRLESFLVRMGYEQFPYQVTPFQDMARTRALLHDAAVETEQDIITPSFWMSVLGCSLDQFVGLALFLHTGAMKNAGVFDPRWLSQPNFGPLFAALPREVIETVASKHFVTSQESFRTIAAAHAITDPLHRRYAFNPILVGPFVQIGNQRPTAPVLRPIWYRATPGSLYYLGARHSDNRLEQDRFLGALGKVFECYVGKQLRLCDPVRIIPEVEYQKGKKSVDYVVVMPSAVVLVEAKSTPLSEGARLGGPKLEADVARAPGKGVEQIEATAALIRSGHRHFAEVPTDRPFVGLVVTLEPYYLWNSELVARKVTPSVPTRLCSSRELESIVAMRVPPMDEFLLKVVAAEDQRGWSLSHSLSRFDVQRNSILDAAWASYPFGK